MAQSVDLLGKHIDNYAVREFLARGGMADVYVARHEGLQRDIVLKILLPSYVENPGFVERFRREAQAMARLQHPNIVQVYDTGDTSDGRPYIAMQYVRGGTLEALLARLEEQGQVMTAPYALAIARQVAAALQAAHAAGIIHRDLKPSNILLDEGGKALLTDLGIAFVQDSQRLTRTDIFLGTPHYMSPEQGKGVPLDARSDIYSLGVVLFEMLTGVRPFQGDSHWALIHQHIADPPPSLAAVRPGLSRGITKLVNRCLEKDPARRYQSAGELAVALDQALAEEGAAGAMTASGEWQWRPRPSGGLYVGREGSVRAVTPRSRNGNRRIVIGVGVLGLALTAGFWALTRGGSAPPDPAPPAAATTLVEVIREITVVPTAATSTPAATADQSSSPVATDVPATVAVPSTSTPAVATVRSGSTSTDQTPSALTIRPVFTRSGPGVAFPVSGSLPGNAPIEVLARDGQANWYLVQSLSGAVAWVPAGLIEGQSGPLDSVSPAATIPAPPTATRPADTPTPPPTSPPETGGGGQPAATAPPPPTAPPAPTNTLAP